MTEANRSLIDTDPLICELVLFAIAEFASIGAFDNRKRSH